MITKYASAAQRSTVDTCRTLVIWCVFLAMGSEKFLVGELFGFFLLVMGTLVYNEIIEIPISLLNKNTKRNRELLADKSEPKQKTPASEIRNSSLGTGSSSGNQDYDDDER
jgi:heme exporter protein D